MLAKPIPKRHSFFSLSSLYLFESYEYFLASIGTEINLILSKFMALKFKGKVMNKVESSRVNGLMDCLVGISIILGCFFCLFP